MCGLQGDLMAHEFYKEVFEFWDIDFHLDVGRVQDYRSRSVPNACGT